MKVFWNIFLLMYNSGGIVLNGTKKSYDTCWLIIDVIRL